MPEVINVNGAVEQLNALTKQLTGPQLTRAVSRGINTTLLKGRTEARKVVKEVYNIPQRYVGAIGIKKSFPNTLSGNINASAKPLPMDAFNPVYYMPGRQTVRVSRRGEQRIKGTKRNNKNIGKGVSIEVKANSREFVDYAFLIPGAKPRVFARGQYKTGGHGFTQRNHRANSGGNDTPIKPLLSITVHAALINKDSIARVKRVVMDNYPTNIEHEIKYMVEKIGRDSLSLSNLL